MEPRLFSTNDAAEYLGISPASLSRARTTGRIVDSDAPPFIKLGTKTVRYLREDLDAWVTQQRRLKTYDEPVE